MRDRERERLKAVMPPSQSTRRLDIWETAFESSLRTCISWILICADFQSQPLELRVPLFNLHVLKTSFFCLCFCFFRRGVYCTQSTINKSWRDRLTEGDFWFNLAISIMPHVWHSALASSYLNSIDNCKLQIQIVTQTSRKAILFELQNLCCVF